VNQVATTRILPEPESVSRTIDLRHRLALFGIDEADLKLARAIWATIEPEAASVSAALVEQWTKVADARPGLFDAGAWDSQVGIAYTHSRLARADAPDWIHAAERTVAEAYAAELSHRPRYR
jgi:hypothetical protein